jgi:hypothetical protein
MYFAIFEVSQSEFAGGIPADEPGEFDPLRGCILSFFLQAAANKSKQNKAG